VSATILLGAVLTLSASDGKTLQLTVSLAESSTCALSWDGVTKTATRASTLHVFRDLSEPKKDPLSYTLSIPREAPRTVLVRALAKQSEGKMRVALYGDTRGGDAAHRLLLQAIEKEDPDLIVQTGDVISAAGDEAGWLRHLTTTLSISERIPVVFALGNHELLENDPRHPLQQEALARALVAIPPPVDPLVREAHASPAAFHVRIGPALFISLDSNAPLGRESPQYRFLERALESRGDARFVFVVMHHGPLSSGPHGPHPDADDFNPLLVKHRVTAVMAGHDHVYERIVRDGVTYLVSGGGGAPLYSRARSTPGSKAFASTYNWVLLTLDGERVSLEARSLEGVLLDRAMIGGEATGAEPERAATAGPLIAAIALVVAAFLYAGVRLARA
jgi:hypothetical protein